MKGENTNTEDDYELKLPFGLPPVLPDAVQQLRQFLLCPERLPIHSVEASQLAWPRVTEPTSLFRADLCAPGTTLEVERDLATGEVIRYTEVRTEVGALNARNSLSLRRAPLPPENATRGSASNFPFWPGGFPEPEVLSGVGGQGGEAEKEEEEELLTIPPGFERGFDFSKLIVEEKKIDIPIPDLSTTRENADTSTIPSSVIDLSAVLRSEGDLLGSWTEPEITKEVTSHDKDKGPDQEVTEQLTGQLELVLPPEDGIPILKISQPAGGLMTRTATAWAEVIDLAAPVTDFEQRVPDMAHKFPFELDPFQKQAILHLERHEHVFVAAHTSAGKTVVAEYAIALSRKNMTRAIYTSPIKALSNQKYRDFQQTFGDVGLITGDFQLNQTASCLVMTTEILRSMLYCGSDVIRDLQYAIFDEVHYVNDAERGHVWEEVLILLPPHVIIVMLSATVPNTLEFADWVGRTKQRRVYVMSTPRRPVPLEHSLYLGFNTGNTPRQFVLLDSEGNFRAHALREARESREKKSEGAASSRGGGGRGGQGGGGRGGAGGRGGGGRPQQQGRGGGGRGGFSSPAQEQTVWLSLLRFLQSKDKLPTIAFTFSRKRCDKNAELLSSVDLLTNKEKSHVHRFISKCLQRLNEADQKLPQVVFMQGLLERGIGVHHSGILPILKEIVELLFQDGFVKFLFATETFAMGVNMPARTVVFDQVRKFDGNESRSLKPAEYIQMAGRAGRRGLDPTGTVLLLVRDRVPEEHELRDMMLGTPTKLMSQFRLTYAMMLSLLRVQSITVEGMMRQSFRELAHKKRSEGIGPALEKVALKLQKSSKPSSPLAPQLARFYDAVDAWTCHWQAHALALLKLPGPAKEASPGRLVVVTRGGRPRLGLVLKVETLRMATLAFKVLVLGEPSTFEGSSDQEAKWQTMVAVQQRDSLSCARELGDTAHCVLSLAPEELWLAVSGPALKVELDKVIGDWENRQIPRFRENPPRAACVHALEELRRASQSSMSALNPRPLLLTEGGALNVVEASLRPAAERAIQLRTQAESLLDLTVVANFEHEFRPVFDWEELTRERERLRHLQSSASLSLFPEYEGRIRVLRELGYVGRDEAVQLKGRVACEMGQHELLITEMVLAGLLGPLNPAEVAALLSGLVYQQRRSEDKDGPSQDDPEISTNLKLAMEQLMELAKELCVLQRRCDVKQEAAEDYEASINFELAPVIHEWATGKPFSQIMQMTDVQEGIIVRCIVQLGETLRDVKDAARIIGDPQLHAKMEEAANAIKRDIVFAASLYTQ